MKVLFLDIDGVLNSEYWFVNRPEKEGLYTQVDPVAVAILSRVIKETGCTIVVSSTWRKVHRDDIVPVLTAAGLLYTGSWYYTPILYKQRGYEIQQWLSEHPDVIAYAIVDDDSDMLPEQLVNYVQTDWRIGLDDTAAGKIIGILNNNQ
jgi:hypothetical protein